MSTLQSLDRGLNALEIISRHPAGVTVPQLADMLEVHRTVGYRIVGTLEGRGLVVRTDEGRVRLGGGIIALSARFAPHLQQAADAVLDELAQHCRATSFVAVADGDQCVVITTAEPDDLVIRIGYRVGSRHSLSTGAAGLAILSLRQPTPNDPSELQAVRQRGYALTRGQLEPGAVGLAAGFVSERGASVLHCSVGVVALDGLDEESAIHQVRQAAHRLSQ